jgi:N utilization substance protein A
VIYVLELDARGLKYFTTFEKITGVMPVDYLENDNGLIFLVDLVKLGKAIGKKGANIKKLKELFRKRVVIIGDSNDPEIFVRNFFSNITITGVEIANVMGDQNIVLTVDEKDRGIAIGKEGERIKAAKEFLKKKFNATIVLRTSRPAISRGVEVDDSLVELKDQAD